MLVLGIETSCDETGVALYDTQKKTLLADKLYSQISIHAQYGGVVPELASRDHIRKLSPLVDEVLVCANIDKTQISAIAYTAGPGLIGALMVGAGFAKSMAYGLGIPAIAIHHLEGHLLAAFLDENNKPSYPFIALLVSGGHTQLIKVLSFGDYQLLGESLDDAAGEAFDKTAKMLGLPYPGGPYLAKLAETGRPGFFKFPRPMIDRPGFDFSFSGLKTAVLNAWNKLDQSQQTKQTKADIAYAFQDALVDTIMIKCRRALKHCNINKLVIAGGVSANHSLRERLTRLMQEQNGNVYFPQAKYCTDNGAMIAIAGAYHLCNNNIDKNNAIIVKPRCKIVENII